MNSEVIGLQNLFVRSFSIDQQNLERLVIGVRGNDLVQSPHIDTEDGWLNSGDPLGFFGGSLVQGIPDAGTTEQEQFGFAGLRGDGSFNGDVPGTYAIEQCLRTWRWVE